MKQTKYIVIADFIRDNPDKSFFEVALHFNLSLPTVSNAAKAFGLSRPRTKAKGDACPQQ